MAIPNEEKETTCVYDYMNKEWNVYTCVPNHLTKLCKIGEPYWKEEEPDKHGNPRIIAGKWNLKKSQVRFAKIIERLMGESEDEEGDDENEPIEDDESAGPDSETIAI